MQKGGYPYEYMDDWEKFNETSLPENLDFYNHSNMWDNTDENYTHAVCKDFGKEIGEYHDLYVQSNTLLLADLFNNFTNMCLQIYELDLAKLLTTSVLPSKSAFALPWKSAGNQIL